MNYKSILKLSLIIGIISLIIFICNNINPQSNNTKNIVFNENDITILFIGSSRIKRSVNPEIIEKQTNRKTYNLGINEATFNQNIILAKYFTQQKGKKIIVIELSPSIKKIPVTFIKASNVIHPDIINFQKIIALYSETDLVTTINNLNNYLFTKLSIQESIKQITKSKKEELIGYVAEEANNYDNTDSFISFEDYSIKNKKNLEDYITKINYLLDLAKKNNTQIKFILPLTFNQETEKAIVFSLFNYIKDENKIKYSKDFLNQINKKEHLFDKNHLNSKGAKIYSNLISEHLIN
jgi:hypothetical protein